MPSEKAIQIALTYADKATAPMRSSLKSIETQLKSVETVAGYVNKAIGLIGISLTTKSALSMGMEYETAVARIKNVFQENANVAIQSLERLSEASHHYFSFTDLAAAAIKIEDTFEIMKMSSGDLETTLARVMDISRAKGLDLEESISKLNSAFMGAAKSGRQLGINLTDSHMQYETFGGVLKDVWQTLSDSDKYWWRYQEFLVQSGKYAGAAAKETGTLSAALRALANTIKEDLEQTFAGASGYLTQLVNWIRKAREENIAASKDVNEKIWQNFRDNAAKMGIVRKPIPIPETPTTTPSPGISPSSAELAPPPGFEGHMTGIKGKGSSAGGREIDPMREWNRVLEEGQRITQANYTDLEKYNAELDRLKWYLDAGAISQDTYTHAVSGTWEALVKAQSATEGWQEFYRMQSEGSKIYEETRTSAEKYANELERLNYILGYGMINQDTYNRAVDAAKNKFSKTTDEMSQFAIQAARNIQDALGDQLYNIMTGKFDSIGSSFGQLLARMASQAAASKIGSWLFGDFGTTKEIGGVFGAIGEFIFGPGKASGGPVFPGRIYPVGERGPELFAPGVSGQIIPNMATNIKIELKNESGQNLQATKGETKMDSSGMIVGVVLREAKTNQAFRSQLSGLLKR